MASHTVSVFENGFSPAQIVVARGDIVVWTNRGRFEHQVKSFAPGFTGALLEPGGVWSYSFSEVGTYHYQDALYIGNQGTIVVT